MKKITTVIFMVLCATISKAQNYNKELADYRKEVKKEFMIDEHSPMQPEEVQYLRYFEPDSTYRVEATFTKTENAKPFDMPTMANKTKQYVEYGKLKFKLKNREFTLTVYQGIKLLENADTKDILFIPFTDSTNGNDSYINGRYLEYRIADIKDNKLVIDFNKCYNPYCAYSDKFNCPKPPAENALAIAIRVGEMNFGLQRH
jgi:uncharacterized protein (DUF1684 family)